MESQRLISVSLGKIAQSRCQRGGINLHKNLLVATVLHKARTAYIMESYNNQYLHQQKLQQGILYNSHQQPSSHGVDESGLNKGEHFSASSESFTSQCSLEWDTQSSPELISSSPSHEITNSELTLPQEMNTEITHDKENSPPLIQDRIYFPENVQDSSEKDRQQQEEQCHIYASNQLSKEAQEFSSNNKTTNCMKRRRHQNTATTQELDSPAIKKPRISGDYQLPYSYDESSSYDVSETDMPNDSPQISNLVNIFNSGFSGLCAVESDSSHNTSSYESDNSSSQFTSKFRADSSTSQVFSKIMPEPSLLCSTQVSRMEMLSSAILLSA
jgi:hypothetical protein